MSTEKQLEELNLTHEDALRRLKARNEEVEQLKQRLQKAEGELLDIRRALDAADVVAYSQDDEMPPGAELPLLERIRRGLTMPQRLWSHYEAIQHALNRAYFGAPYNQPGYEKEAQSLRQKAYNALEAIFHRDAKREPSPSLEELVDMYHLDNLPELLAKVKRALSIAHHGASLAVSLKLEQEASQADAAFDELERAIPVLKKQRDMALVRLNRDAARLADEVAVLVRRRVIDQRSPAADALLDFREPPSTPRADRMALLEREVDRLTQVVKFRQQERETHEEGWKRMLAERQLVGEVLGSLRDMVVSATADLPEDRRLVWMFAILCGWGHLLTQVCAKWQWSEEDRERLERYHELVKGLLPKEPVA